MFNKIMSLLEVWKQNELYCDEKFRSLDWKNGFFYLITLASIFCV